MSIPFSRPHCVELVGLFVESGSTIHRYWHFRQHKLRNQKLSAEPGPATDSGPSSANTYFVLWMERVNTVPSFIPSLTHKSALPIHITQGNPGKTGRRHRKDLGQPILTHTTLYSTCCGLKNSQLNLNAWWTKGVTNNCLVDDQHQQSSHKFTILFSK